MLRTPSVIKKKKALSRKTYLPKDAWRYEKYKPRKSLSKINPEIQISTKNNIKQDPAAHDNVVLVDEDDVIDIPREDTIPREENRQLTTVNTVHEPDPFDPVKNDQEYCRALLSKEEKEEIDEDGGLWDITAVREFINENTIKETLHSQNEIRIMDPNMILVIDQRTNFKIFVTADNVYLREELLKGYPFEEFNVPPESMFDQQEIGVFPPKKHSLGESEFEYMNRTVGDTTVDFIMVEDLVRQSVGKKHKTREPVRILKTKVYLGNEKWESFKLVHRLAQCRKTIIDAQLPAPSERSVPMLMSETLNEAERIRRQKYEAEAEQREKEAQERLKKLEEMQKTITQRIVNDVKRIVKNYKQGAPVKQQKTQTSNQKHSQPSSSTPQQAAEVIEGADEDDVDKELDKLLKDLKVDSVEI